jgi:hypothetical protein
MPRLCFAPELVDGERIERERLVPRLILHRLQVQIQHVVAPTALFCPCQRCITVSCAGTAL